MKLTSPLPTSTDSPGVVFGVGPCKEDIVGIKLQVILQGSIILCYSALKASGVGPNKDL